MPEEDETSLREVHHTATTILQQSFLCMAEGRAGREWVLRIKHAHERMGLMIKRLEKSDA